MMFLCRVCLPEPKEVKAIRITRRACDRCRKICSNYGFEELPQGDLVTDAEAGIKPIQIGRELTDEQSEKVRTWWKEHPCPAREEWLKKEGDLRCFPGPFGGRMKYEIEPLSVGTWINVVCLCCQSKLEDITDLEDNW